MVCVAALGQNLDVDGDSFFEFGVGDSAVERHDVHLRIEHVEGRTANAGSDVVRQRLENLANANGHILLEPQRVDHVDQGIVLGMHLAHAVPEVLVSERLIGRHYQCVGRSHGHGCAFEGACGIFLSLRSIRGVVY